MRRSNLGVVNARLSHRAGSVMAQYDRLPPLLRRWLASAALPWSPWSAAKAYARALRRCAGDPARVMRELDRVEAATLARLSVSPTGGVSDGRRRARRSG